MTTEDMERFRPAILAVRPDLAGATFTLATAGWDSIAVDVDDHLIFKFPRHDVAERALIKEASLLAEIRPNVSMPVPDLRLVQGPPLFSVHEKLPGEHLLAAHYDLLPEDARRQLGDLLGQFYAQLHRLDDDRMIAAGAGEVGAWQPLLTIRELALPTLAPDLRRLAAATISAYEQLPPDPYGVTYGYFDGHGWNMAFDHANGRLNGLYDFADSGIGPLHREFIYSSFVAADLTERIITAYEREADRPLDRRRISILTGLHRLSELAELIDDPENSALLLANLEAWAETADGLA